MPQFVEGRTVGRLERTILKVLDLLKIHPHLDPMVVFHLLHLTILF